MSYSLPDRFLDILFTSQVFEVLSRYDCIVQVVLRGAIFLTIIKLVICTVSMKTLLENLSDEIQNHISKTGQVSHHGLTPTLSRELNESESFVVTLLVSIL